MRIELLYEDAYKLLLQAEFVRPLVRIGAAAATRRRELTLRRSYENATARVRRRLRVSRSRRRNGQRALLRGIGRSVVRDALDVVERIRE